MEQPHTDIVSIGEFGLIDRIRSIVDFRVDDAALHEHLIIGISDDAAVFRPTAGRVQLLTTDSFVEGVHFDLTFTAFKHLGWKAMAASFSDIAAMNAVPRYATVALSLPKKISVEMVEEFYQGAALCCKKYAVLIVGGDTTTSLGNAVVSVTVTGEADPSHVTYRRGAKVGDYICVSGHLGAAVAGLKVLQREKKRFSESVDPRHFTPNLELYAPALEKHLMPKPRLDITNLFRNGVTVNAMIDVSDGLASEVHHLCTSGNVGAAIYEHNLPVESVTQRIAEEFSQSPIELALYGGEEYELLFTLTDAEYEKLEQLSSDITVIGRITEKSKGIVLVRENGEEEPLRFGGWEHFKE